VIGERAVVLSFVPPPAPVAWCGWQDCQGLMADFEQWTLTACIPGHPVHSTLSRETLEAAGFTVPPAPCLSPTQARERAHAFNSTRRSMGSRASFSS
jgi:hypothetical protein